MKFQSDYLKLLESFKITPNFWCSAEYFKKAGLQERYDKNWIYIWDPENEITVLPPLNKNFGSGPIRNESEWAHRFWADFPNYFPGNDYVPGFLDFNYIYDPKNFLKMDGSKWAVFRKNTKKFPKRYEKKLQYVTSSFLIEDYYENSITSLFLSWIESRRNNVQEAEVLFEYANSGSQRGLLLDEDGEVLGVNAWDENWEMINFRLCMTKPEQPFLNEYMRLLFYTSAAIQKKGKLVNDGGVLDNSSLKEFKDKLCPLKVNEIKTWIRKG